MKGAKKDILAICSVLILILISMMAVNLYQRIEINKLLFASMNAAFNITIIYFMIKGRIWAKWVLSIWNIVMGLILLAVIYPVQLPLDFFTGYILFIIVFYFLSSIYLMLRRNDKEKKR